MNLVQPPVQHDLLTKLQRFQHPCHHQIDQYGAIVGSIRVNALGQILDSSNSPTIAQRSISGGFIAISDVAAKSLKSDNYFCQSVQITSVRRDWTDNIGRIGIGDASTWYSALDPMGMQLIEAPLGGVLNLKEVFIYGNAIGDQVHFLILNII
jgi:hypothetical protein